MVDAMAASGLQGDPVAGTAGTVVPDEGQSVGVYYERMDERLKSALKRLKDDYKFEDINSRREEVRKVRKAREFWRGHQNIYWSETQQAWHLPTENPYQIEVGEQDQPKFDFVTNIYQAFGLSLIAVLSQSVPATRLQPQSVNQQGDVATAKAGNEVIKLIERNNDAQALLTDLSYYLWTDGKAGGYIRYVVDGGRFGYDEVPILEPNQINLAPSSTCPVCLAEIPLVNSGECPNCGAPIPEDLYAQPAYSMPYPEQAGTRRFPRGQEVMDVVGALELRTPMWANKQEEFPYLMWSVEMHESRLKAAYPHVADKIGSQSFSGGDSYEKVARLRIQYGGAAEGEGTQPYGSMATYDRVWLRPWALYKIGDEEIRKELLEMFPDGVYCAFAGDVFCEARPENMDDHWSVMQALPGDGQNRPAIGTSFISMQERFNTLSNLIIENIEYGVPPIYADAAMLDFDQLQDTTAQPGAIYPVQRGVGKSIQEGFFQPRPAQIHQDAYRLMNDLLGPHGQFVTGGFPALFGGSMQNVDTASGYAMARDQALGRTGIMYRGIKSFWGRLMLKGVNVARTHRLEDIENSILGEGGQWMGAFIRIADLKGNVQVYEDTSEQFPRLWTQQRAIMLQLLDRGNESVMALLFQDPDNFKELQRLIGLENFKAPFENERDKQMREIAQLLEERPIELPDGRVYATILPDELVDNHEVEAQAARSWLSSPEGLAAAEKNPEGWLNVRAHLMMHELIVQQRQAAQTVMTAAEEAEANSPAEPAQSKPKGE